MSVGHLERSHFKTVCTSQTDTQFGSERQPIKSMFSSLSKNG